MISLPNPFDFVHEIREANEKLLQRLDEILIELRKANEWLEAISRNE